jgi:glycosyltransferase involved in cell wall biosynthesis
VAVKQERQCGEPPLRIGFNAHLLPVGATYRSAGVATYVRQMLERLPRVAPEYEYVFFTPPTAEPLVRRCSAIHIPSRLPTSRPLVRIAWEQGVAPLLVRRFKLDLLHSPVNVAPLLLDRPSVLTIHDLAFLIHPERLPKAKQAYLRGLVRASVARATHVITISQKTKEDLVNYFNVREERISVVYLGVDERYRPLAVCCPPIERPYILYVGTIEPRKNLDVLVRAFAVLRQRGYPHRLVLVGARGWLYADLFQLIAALGLEEAVVEVGFVDDLVPWYNCADLFVYPSQYEGFGLPPLEAMACGVPVVVSSGGALGEVVADAALTASPGDEEALVEAMRAVLDNTALAQRLAAAGRARAATFSWDQTARRTAAVYREVGA